MIKFNIPCHTGSETDYVLEVIKNRRMCGNGDFTKKCENWFLEKTCTKKALLTTSCTDALEMCAILLDIKSGDEIIMPSYTFVSTANAFVLRGAKIVFVDIRGDTLNIDENKIENAITKNTKAIVVVHYAGVSCEMDRIINIAKKYKIFVVEDAAQGMMSFYKGRSLGSIGHLGVYSFHETKNYTSGGEGGLLLINDERFVERSEIIREKGTNRSLYLRGMVDKYSWVDIGSSFLPSELNAAYLFGQLNNAERINEYRLSIWNRYFESLSILGKTRNILLPTIPSFIQHNAHIFYLIVNGLDERTALIQYLKEHNIESVFHYIPLHSSKIGKKIGTFNGEDEYTTQISKRIIRLPIHYHISIHEVDQIIETILEFYKIYNDKIKFTECSNFL